MSLLDTAKKYQPLFVEWRRHLHAHPELSGKEYETAAWIEKILDGFGVPHERMADILAALFRLVDHTAFDRYAVPILKQICGESAVDSLLVL